MKQFVLDCSVFVSWCFEDEKSADSIRILESLQQYEALVPSLWTLEVANVFLTAWRRKTLTESDIHQLIQNIKESPIQIDTQTAEKALNDIFVLAREHELSAYDAAYLELAMRRGIALATFDQKLRKACQKSGVKIFQGKA